MSSKQNIPINKKNITAKFNKLRKNRNIFVFIIFFFIATILWFLTTLNKEYTTEIDLPIRYSNIPNKNELKSELTKQIQVTISGHGYNILQIIMDRFAIPLQLNLRNLTVYQTPHNSEIYFLLTKDINNLVAKRIGRNVEVLSIKPDTLYFNYYSEYSKNVPVNFIANYTIPKGFILTKPVSISPDTVLIFGKEAHVLDISDVSTVSKNLGIIRPNIKYKIDLEEINNVNTGVEYIEAEFYIEKYVEEKVNINVTPINFPNDFNTVIVPSSVSLTLNIPISTYNNFSKNSIKVFADYETRSNNRIELRVTTENESITLVRIQPQTVHFLLERK